MCACVCVTAVCVRTRVCICILLLSLVPDVKCGSFEVLTKNKKTSALIHASQSVKCFQAIWVLDTGSCDDNTIAVSFPVYLISLSSLSNWIKKIVSGWC